MARDLMDETYYTAKTRGAKIPIKWTAPEVWVGDYIAGNAPVSSSIM